MKTKLQVYTVALCIGLLGIVNTGKATTFTFVSGDPSVRANWSPVPANFTANSQTFKFTTSATLANVWTVSGSGSEILVSSGTFSDGGFALTSVKTVVSNGATLKIANNNFSPGVFQPAAGSTVNYATAAGSQNILQGGASGYSNLTISGAATMNLAGQIIVGKVLTINASCALTLNGLELDLNGTIAGAGTITGDESAYLILGSSATAFGTISFTSGSQQLDQFSISGCAGTTTVTLGTNLTVIDDGNGLSDLDISSNTLNLNGHTLITDVSCVEIDLGGTITGSTTSSLQLNFASGGTFNNGSLLMDQTSSASQSLSNFTFNDGGNRFTLTLGNNLNIIDSISPISGSISGPLTLIADQATIGHVGRVGFVGGDISNVSLTSQVYHNPPPGNTSNWMLMGVAGVSGATFSQWDADFYITCPTCPSTGPTGGGAFTSVTTYDEPSDGFPAITYASNIATGVGYWVFMGTSYQGGASSPELISVTGTPVQGTGTWTGLTSSGVTADKGSNLIANPYPSPISWDKVIADNPTAPGAGLNTIYVYCPTLGTYATYQSNGGASISSPAYVPGTASINAKIPAGQGFYVITNGSVGSINYSESEKVMSGSDSSFVMRTAKPNSVQSSSFAYFRLSATAGSNTSEAVISFNPNGTMGVDPYDSQAMTWNNVLQISTTILGNNYVINGLPGLTQNYSIPVKILSGTTTQYAISTVNLASLPSGACLILHDNYAVMPDQDLRAGTFNVTVNDTETVARFVLNITILPLNITTNTRQASCPATTDGLITAIGNDAGPWNYTWKNASGTIVKTSLNKSTADSLTGLNNGVYSVDVSTVGTCNSATQTFTITAPAAPTSVFTAPTTVNIGTNVNFTNNSTNATNYVWSFGDGGISSQQTPSYIYNNAGTYTITLDAIIASCNDTVSSKQVIQVDASTTGIKQISGSGNITLSRDGSGNYLQFDYANQTKVNITVYNILGQNLLNNAGVTVVNDRVYLNINGSENQVLYVTITNLNNNQQTTKKFVND